MDWQTLKQDIDRLYRRSQQSEQLAEDQLWDMYSEAIFLRECLYESISESEPQELIATAQQLTQADQFIHREAYQRAQSFADEAREWLQQRIGELDKRIRSLLSEVSNTPTVIAARLHGYSGELLFLKQLAVWLEQGKYQSILPDVFSEIHYQVILAAERSELFATPLISDKLAKLRAEALSREVEVFRREADRLLTSENIPVDRLWEGLSWGHSIFPNISRSDSSHRPLREACGETREQLRSRIAAALAEPEPQERYRLLERLALDLQERIDEVIVNIEEVSLSAAIKNMLSIKQDSDWFLDLLAQNCEEDDVPDSLRLRYRKLAKINRSLRNEIQEKNLQERLEKIFGKKFVVFSENLILSLIVLVIVLLVIESTVALSPLMRHTFLILDTAICAIFLLEFFGKLFLAQGKLLYFWRHFIIDFLPSIPFGLLLTAKGLEYARLGRAGRFLRLPRLLRYVRVARPLIRIFRVITFLLRGTDRLIHRYARWLNRNIVFFGTREEVQHDKKNSLKQQIQQLRGICLNRSRFLFRQNQPEQNRPYLLAYLAALEVRLEKSNGGIIVKDFLVLSPDILVEDVLAHLLHIESNQVEEIMGRDFPYLIHQYIGILNAPLIRWLPGIRSLVRQRNTCAPPEFTAWLARRCARLAESLLAIVYWFTDLYGIVTGPRLLDRIANTMVRSFQRPAKRLLIIGGVFLVCKLMVDTLGVSFLENIVHFLDRFVGKPLIIIGGICLMPLGLGIWLRNIAGEATEFYERTAEAQFINLLKQLKWYNAREDLQILDQRVLLPERALATNNSQSTTVQSSMAETLLRELTDWEHKEDDASSRVTTRWEARCWKLRHQVMLLYKDYLDGAPLHSSDVKTTEQLLGNITLGNIRAHRLGYTRKEYRELEKLDLGRHRIFTGPYIWFSLITQSIAHNTAQLIVEYNKNCIAEGVIDIQPQEAREGYQQWLGRRLNLENSPQEAATPAMNSPQSPHRKRKGAVPCYLTTNFTALHFLTVNKAQDETVRIHFGEELYQAFIKDRQELLRLIFGSYPLQNLSRSQRSVNLYQLYQEYMAGGRIFTLPLKMVGWLAKAIWIIISWLYQKIKEIVKPDEMKAPPLSAKGSFEVAIRKINRMRKPVYIACMKLRAQYDFEYLGLHFPPLPKLADAALLGSGAGQQYQALFERDLDFIGSMNREYDYFRDLRNQRQKRLHRFNELLDRKGWRGDDLTEYLRQINPALATHKNEILRALAIAYTIDYRRLASLCYARETIEDVFKQVIQDKGHVPGYHIGKRLWTFCYRFIKTIAFTTTDWESESFDQFWQDSGYQDRYGKPIKKWCWRAYLANRNTLKDVLNFIAEEGDIAIIDEVLQQIICNPTPWTEELIAVRTIQSLAVMDVQNYRRHVAHLGDYPEKENYGAEEK